MSDTEEDAKTMLCAAMHYGAMRILDKLLTEFLTILAEYEPAAKMTWAENAADRILSSWNERYETGSMMTIAAFILWKVTNALAREAQEVSS